MFEPQLIKRFGFLIILLCFINMKTEGQNDQLSNAIEIEESIESIIAANPDLSDAQLNEITERLNAIYQSKVDINTSDLRVFTELLLLNDIQIQAILVHRNKYGKYAALYELQTVNSIELSDIKRILPYLKPIGIEGVTPFDWNMLYKGNYEELLKQHIESGAEVSVLYQHVDNAKENYIGCDVLQMNKQRGVLSIDQNLGNYKSRYLSLQTYIMSKEIFKTLVEEAQETSSMYWFKDILNDKCVDMDIRGLNYRGHIYVINDLKSYYESNMQFLTEEKMKDIADPEWPVYTRTSDSAPAIYLNGGTATGSLISNGCEISGVVKNSIVGRSCKIGKDALIENCIIMPDVEIADGAHLKNVIVDKHSRIAKKKDLAGLEEQPLYIGRRENV